MRSDEHMDVVFEVRELLNKRLGLSWKNHGAWRIQFLICDELEEKDKIEEQSNKEKEKIHLA
mgnify:FL=1|tara:strand:+ start:3195 stop:3380 length:186 start_codon:yes stop_codon:yes gene_type:complete